MALRAPRIAVDLLGGDAGLPTVVDGAVLAADQWPELTLLLVGPAGDARAALAARGAEESTAGPGLRIVPASQGIAHGRRSGTRRALAP